jgi:hypothetical protein
MHTHSRLKVTLLLIVTALAFAGCAAWPTQFALTMTNEDNGALVYVRSVETGDTFSIRFIHSVHRTPVEEQFRIFPTGEMVLERVIYETYGVGNPSAPEPGQHFRIDDGMLIIENMNRRLPEIHQRIGQKLADHQLIIDGKRTPFATWSPPGSRVLLKVRKVSLWALWRGGTTDV